MTAPDALERALRRVLWSIRPYLPDVVVIGGWVPHLYRAYGGFAHWTANLSRTAAVDVVVDPALDAAGRPTLATLLDSHGFHPLANMGGAVWANDPATGEKLELFVPHDGVARDLGRSKPLPAQGGVGAIALSDLSLLQTHTRLLHVPVTGTGVGATELAVRVPTLGAYVVTKAITFFKRGTTADAIAPHRTKRAKDVVYLHDVMAAGADVVAQVERDIDALRHAGQAEVDALRSAANNLSLLRGRPPSPVAGEAADILAERDLISRTAAIQAVQGFTQDLHEMLDRGFESR